MDSYQLTFQAWDKAAAAYQHQFMGITLYDDTYDSFCRLIQKSAPRIFEIGCGPGNITKYLLSKRPDFKMDAIDVAPEMIKLAKENNPAAHFRVMDCRELDLMTTVYDAIVCGFCMPYLSEADCRKLILDCSRLLPHGGFFYCSTIEGDPSQSGYETGSDGTIKMYVYYHSENALKEALESNAFDLLELKRKDYFKKDGSHSTHLVFIARKK